MDFHFVYLPVGAPADHRVADICFPSFKDSTNSLTKKHLPGCDCNTPVGRQHPFGSDIVVHLTIDINPYPPDYKAAFASSCILLSHLQQRALRFHLPYTSGRDTRFPRSTLLPIMDDLGLSSTPAVQHLRMGSYETHNLTAYLLVQA